MKMVAVKTLYVEEGEMLKIDEYPNFNKNGSITGMKKKYYGNMASPALEGLIETYNYHMTQYVAVYVLWKKYGYPKTTLDMHIKYHVDKIIE
jgi:hypothetical protein